MVANYRKVGVVNYLMLVSIIADVLILQLHDEYLLGFWRDHSCVHAPVAGKRNELPVVYIYCIDIIVGVDRLCWQVRIMLGMHLLNKINVRIIGQYNLYRASGKLAYIWDLDLAGNYFLNWHSCA